MPLEAGRPAEPQARARHFADRGRDRPGLSGAGRRTPRRRESRSPSARSTPGRTSRSYGKWPFAIDFWVGLPYLVVASIADGPGANVVNTTHFNDPQFNTALQPGLEAARHEQAHRRSSTRCNGSSTSAAATSSGRSRTASTRTRRRSAASSRSTRPPGAQPLPAPQALLPLDHGRAGRRTAWPLASTLPTPEPARSSGQCLRRTVAAHGDCRGWLLRRVLLSLFVLFGVSRSRLRRNPGAAGRPGGRRSSATGAQPEQLAALAPAARTRPSAARASTLTGSATCCTASLGDSLTSPQSVGSLLTRPRVSPLWRSCSPRR